MSKLREDRNTLEGMLAALDARFDSSDLEGTVRDYLYQLLDTLWSEQESFSGKRPLGNSGWEYDVYEPLIRGRFITGTVDEYGAVHGVNPSAHKYVHSLIRVLCYGSLG